MDNEILLKEGDVIHWKGAHGDVRAIVKRDEEGDLCAFTDELHCIPLSKIDYSSITIE